MFDKIKSAAKSPSTYVILALGVILTLAYGRFFANWFRPVAKVLPKSEA